MSIVILWRCVDCAATGEAIANEPSRLLGMYIPEGWSLQREPDTGTYLVRCDRCSVDHDLVTVPPAAEGADDVDT